MGGLGSTILFQPELLRFASMAILRATLVAAAGFVLNRIGRQKTGAAVLLLGFMFNITLVATKAGGVRSPGVQFFFVLAMLAALLFGGRSGLWAGAACVLITLGLALAETAGLIGPPLFAYNVWVLWTLNAMYVAFFVFTLHVSMRALREAVARLEEHRRSLEDLVEKRTEELRKARDAAEAANRAKSVFLANMSHEIRTPMNAVLGFAQLLLRDPSSNPGQRRHLATIVRAGDHLTSLIDGILQLAKVESGHDSLSIAAFDLWALADDIQALFQPRADDKQLQLAVERAAGVPRHIRGDQGKLRQVLSNLVGNALKFTARGGVTVRLRAHQGRLHVQVEDTGPGIAPSELSRLFQKFEQTSAGRASKQGTGLGLAICRELVELMGGEISVESELGRGSVFRFTIPVTEVAASAENAAVMPALRLDMAEREYRVLVADDTEDNRVLLTALLSGVGFETRQCSTGAHAVQEFSRFRPDLILMDVRMPDLDGIEATRAIRRAPGGEHVRILCVSASAYDDDVQAALAAGADGFLRKPIRDAVLLEQVAGLLGLRYQSTGDAHPAGRELTSAAVAVLPESTREALRRATRSADLDAMLAVIDGAAARDPAIAATLRKLAEQFAYERIAELLQEPASEPERSRT